MAKAGRNRSSAGRDPHEKSAKQAAARSSGRVAGVKHWRRIIGGVFLLALLAQIALATLLRIWGYINPEDFTPLIVKLLTIYSAPFGVILAGIFVAQKIDAPRAAAEEVWIVLVLAIIWNALLLGRYLLITFKPVGDSLEDLASFQNNALPAGNFLISAALTYLYGAHKP